MYQPPGSPRRVLNGGGIPACRMEAASPAFIDDSVSRGGWEGPRRARRRRRPHAQDGGSLACVRRRQHLRTEGGSALVALDGVPERRMEAALPAFVGGSVPARTT